MARLHCFVAHELKERADFVEVIDGLLESKEGRPLLQGLWKFSAPVEIGVAWLSLFSAKIITENYSTCCWNPSAHCWCIQHQLPSRGWWSTFIIMMMMRNPHWGWWCTRWHCWSHRCRACRAVATGSTPSWSGSGQPAQWWWWRYTANGVKMTPARCAPTQTTPLQRCRTCASPRAHRMCSGIRSMCIFSL